jgi:hypothetical protein
MDFDTVEIGHTCKKCGTDFSVKAHLTPSEMAEKAKARTPIKIPTRCPGCGEESETVMRPFPTGQG